jgi:hypothetical protein
VCLCGGQAYDPEKNSIAFAIVSGNTNSALRFGTPFASVSGGNTDSVYVFLFSLPAVHVGDVGSLRVSAFLPVCGRYVEVNNPAALDFETVPGQQFVLSCTASDGLGGVRAFTVTVALRNVNESPVPTLSS